MDEQRNTKPGEAALLLWQRKREARLVWALAGGGLKLPPNAGKLC
jgi:ADP-ribose pyrophosphatase YjhB (NUDIX family)